MLLNEELTFYHEDRSSPRNCHDHCICELNVILITSLLFLPRSHVHLRQRWHTNFTGQPGIILRLLFPLRVVDLGLPSSLQHAVQTG
jgi:uncharacterized membrane protein YGL010W